MGGGGAFGFKILFDGETGEEGGDEAGDDGGIEFGFFGADIFFEECSETDFGFGEDFVGFGGEDAGFAHGVDAEATFLAVGAFEFEFGVLFVVMPAVGLCGVDGGGAEIFGVVAEAGEEEVLLVLEFGIEAGFVYAGGEFEVVEAGVGVAVIPEDGDGLFEDVFAGELFGPAHGKPMTGGFFSCRGVRFLVFRRGG